MSRVSRIGTLIREARTACGMTSKQLAEQTGLSQQYVGEVQRGSRIPSPETMLLFANIFPDEDTTAWCWELLADVWGPSIAGHMREHAVRTAEREDVWLVVERLVAIGLDVVLASVPGGWEIEVLTTEALAQQGYAGCYVTRPTMPEAICRAVLLSFAGREADR